MTNTNTVSIPPATGPITTIKAPRSRPSSRRDALEVGGLAAALLVLVIVFSVASPRFATLANLQDVLDAASVPIIIGVGATLVILMGSIDLSVEGVMAAAGMTYILLIANSRGATDQGIVSILAPLAVGLVLGLVTGLIHTRLKVPSFIVTLGMWYVGLGIATILFGTDAIPTISNRAISNFPTAAPAVLPNSFLLALVVLVIGFLITRFTRLGRFAYAIGDNEPIARSNGVHVARYKVSIFAVAGLCTALAGVLATQQLGAGQVTVGVGNLFLTIPAVVIGGTSLGGGRGGVLRTALGVLVLVTLNNGLIVSGVSSDIRTGVSGLVLILAVVAAGWAKRDRLAVAK